MSATAAQLPATGPLQFALTGRFRRCGSIPELSACSNSDAYTLGIDRQASGRAEPDPAPGFWGLLSRGRRRHVTSDGQPASAAALNTAPLSTSDRDALRVAPCEAARPLQTAPIGGFRRCSSVPSLSSMASSAAEGEGLDVYVALRPFYCKLPLVDGLKNSLLMDVGACHHIVVLKAADGTLTSCDYGPNGGRDVAVTAPSGIWSLFRGHRGRSASLGQALLTDTARHIAGEVRERRLQELPAKSMYVGKTHLKMVDIRSFNQLQQQIYRLHHNDCRHYVNKLVKFATGIEGATQTATRTIFAMKRRPRHVHDQLISMGHSITDIGTWPRLRAAGHAALAAIAAVSTRRAWASFGAARAPISAGVMSAAPQRSLVMARALSRPPRALLPVGAAAASAVTGEGTLFASVGDGIKSAAGGAVALFKGLGRSAAEASGCAANASAVTAAVCGSASRGVAGIMLVRQGSPVRGVPRLPQLPRFRRRHPAALALAGP